MGKVVNQEAPVTNEIPRKKDWKALIRDFIKERKERVPIIVGIFFFLVVLITIGIASWFIVNKNINKQATNISNGTLNSTPPTSFSSSIKRPKEIPPTPTPVPFPVGPQIYSVSSKNLIQVTQLYISALNTKIGDSQTLKLTIDDPKSKITSVTTRIITDHKSSNHNLSLASTTGTTSIWQMTWVMDDTHGYNYQAAIIIKDQAGNTFSFTPTFR